MSVTALQWHGQEIGISHPESLTAAKARELILALLESGQVGPTTRLVNREMRLEVRPWVGETTDGRYTIILIGESCSIVATPSEGSS